jgi:hypothetical protein
LYHMFLLCCCRKVCAIEISSQLCILSIVYVNYRYMGPLLEHLQEFLIKPPNLGFLARIENTHLQEFPIPPPNLLALEKKITQRAQRSACLTRVYRSPNLKVEGHEKE